MKSRLVLPGLYSTYLYSKKVELDLFSIQNTKCSDLLILIFRGTLAPCLSMLSSSLIPILSESTSRLLLTNGKKSVGPDSHAPAVSLYVLYTTSNWPTSATTCYRDVTITEELTSQSESKHIGVHRSLVTIYCLPVVVVALVRIANAENQGG